ncbi:MAG: DUF3817 domain-containing protein [Pseudomonadota bacterium]
MSSHTSALPPDPLRFIRWSGGVEGLTLIVLMLVAMPLKRLFGVPEAVTWMGPIHGVAFLVYLYAVVEVWSAGDLSGRRLAISILACFVPFGAWLNNRYLHHDAVDGPSGPSERSAP